MLGVRGTKTGVLPSVRRSRYLTVHSVTVVSQGSLTLLSRKEHNLLFSDTQIYSDYFNMVVCGLCVDMT